MGMGPITIFDKSALQSLSMDESVWLDAFFLVNVVPLFYAEVLADLEKTLAGDRSAEDLVAMLAEKTPPDATPNVSHRPLLAAELGTGWEPPMDGRIPIGGGNMMRGEAGEIGVHVDKFDEAVALNRWKQKEFRELERLLAKNWRDGLVEADRDRTIGIVRNIVPAGTRVSDLADLKREIDNFCATSARETIALALAVLGVPKESSAAVLRRWETLGRPALPDFAPYATHVFKVDLLYYLGIDRGFISGERTTNKVDMAYLYYLPFCMVFTSGDNLHRRVAPLFLRDDQSFVAAPEFKAGLSELDEYYDQLPDEIKQLGVMAFAHVPPPDLYDNVVVKLWDKHLRPEWRERAETPDEILARYHEMQSSDAGTASVAEVRERLDMAQPLAEDERERFEGEPDYIVIARKVPVSKGKWRLLPEGVEEDE